MEWLAIRIYNLLLHRFKDARSWIVEKIVIYGLYDLRHECAPRKGLLRLLLALGLKRPA